MLVVLTETYCNKVKMLLVYYYASEANIKLYYYAG